jgi:CHAD domain-containing protein
VSKALRIESLDPAAPYRSMAARVIAVRAEEVFDHEAGALDTQDIDGVHDMRVATRRLRAALEFFAPCFPSRPFNRALRDVKALADALGERRDPDVQIASLREMREAGPPHNRAALDGLAASFAERQRRGNDALARELDRVHRGDLAGRLARLARSAA